MNLLTCWIYPVYKNDLTALKENLKITYLGNMYAESEKKINDPIVENIYLYEKLEFFENKEERFVPLDREILDKICCYEEQAMDIVYRWRRSYISGEGYKDIKKLHYVFLNYWNNYIEMHDINCYILNILPHIPMTFYPYIICKAKNIPILMTNNFSYINGSKMRWIITKGYEEIGGGFQERVKKYMDDIQQGKEIELSDKTLEYLTMYESQNKNKRTIGVFEKVDILSKTKEYLNRGKVYFRKHEFKLLLNKVFYLIKLRLFEKSFLRKIEKLEDKNSRCKSGERNKQYFYFPLHMQPEATTLPLGGWFCNQYIAIKMVSRCLPKGTYLIVKEHPMYWKRKSGYDSFETIREARDIDFYKKIIRLKNVRLISHSVDSLELINQCAGIVTITGTAGFEAFINKKPVLYFGNIPYNEFPNAYKIKTVEDCRIALNEITAGRNRRYGDDEIKVYLKALEKNLISIGTVDRGVIDCGGPRYSEADGEILTKALIDFYKAYYS